MNKSTWNSQCLYNKFIPLLVGSGSMNLNLNTYPQIWNHVAIEIVEAASKQRAELGGGIESWFHFRTWKIWNWIFSSWSENELNLFWMSSCISSLCMMLFSHVPTCPLSIPSLFSSPLYSLSHLNIYILVLKWLLSFGLFILCVCVCVLLKWLLLCKMFMTFCYCCCSNDCAPLSLKAIEM